MLGQRIAVLRRAAGMSQAELAHHLQVSPSTVGMYEQGRREPSGETLVSLAALFGVTTDYLLTGKPSADQDARTLTELFDGCLEKARQRLEQRKGEGLTRQELLGCTLMFGAVILSQIPLGRKKPNPAADAV